MAWDNLSELEVIDFIAQKTNKSFSKKGKLYGHLFTNYKEKIQLQFKYACFIK